MPKIASREAETSVLVRDGHFGLVAMQAAAPLVRAGFLAVAPGHAMTLPERPAVIEDAYVCAQSGMKPGPACPHSKLEHFRPGTVPAGVTSQHTWAMWDILPTFAELAGVAPPATIDGRSMAALFTGQGEAPEHEHLYWEFYERGSAQAVRAGDWKAVRQPMTTGPIELYDLSADPGESRDLAARHPEVVTRMRQIMEEAHEPSALWQPPQPER